MKFFRVCNTKSEQGLWYNFKGDFTGLIHNEFKFCNSSTLEMDFDPELVGWLSATPTLETLYQWFSEEEIKKLQGHGWFIHEYETDDVKFYERFQHHVIKQETSKLTNIIKL